MITIYSSWSETEFLPALEGSRGSGRWIEGLGAIRMQSVEPEEIHFPPMRIGLQRFPS